MSQSSREHQRKLPEWVVPPHISLVEVVHVATPKASGEGHCLSEYTEWSCSKRGKESRTIRLDDQRGRNVSIRDSPFFPQLIFTNLDMNVAHISPAVGERAGGPPVGVRISGLGRDEAMW